MTVVLWIVSGLVGLGIGFSFAAGEWVNTLYGVGIVTILTCMHDVIDTCKLVKGWERAE